MALIRPRLLDHFGIPASQERTDFAIPFLDEDIPLCIDPFLLWKSPSQHENALHNLIVEAFDRIGHAAIAGKRDEAIEFLIRVSECEEVGLGVSSKRVGKRIGTRLAKSILDTVTALPRFKDKGLVHIEVLQLLVDGISRDRISDFAACILRDHLIHYTMSQAAKVGLPASDTTIDNLYDHKTHAFKSEVVKLPISPTSGRPLLLVPKRWLRYVPWITFDSYFETSCPHDDIAHKGQPLTRSQVLDFNRHNFGYVSQYVEARERTADDCRSDPLFTQIPVMSAKRRLQTIRKINPGREGGIDKRYEEAVCALLPTLLYPDLDFAKEQARTESGVSIRDLIFYNTQVDPFLAGIGHDFESRQIVFELKNVLAVAADDIDQLHRYLPPAIGRFGVIVTRNELPAARQKQAVDLWSSRRTAIVALCDADLEQMVDVYESKQRKPIDVLKKKYVEFQRLWPN
jgi:hypothetical protein